MMESLSPEEYNALENMKASFRQERADLLAAADETYKNAVELEGMFGLNDGVVEKFHRASQDYIAGIALDSVIGPDEIQLDQPIKPAVTYLRVADSLVKRAMASDPARYNDRLASTLDSQAIEDPEAYLGPKALRYFDKGIELLLEADPDSLPTGIEIPDSPSEVVASAFVKAVKVADSTQEHKILADTSESVLASELDARGPEELEEILDKVPARRAKLEVVSLASRQLNDELASDDRHLSLAA